MIRKIIFVSFSGRNAGEHYCNPSLYYNFPIRSERISFSKFFNHANIERGNLYIIGGGGLLDTNTNSNRVFMSLPDKNKYVLWGAGTNRLILDNVNWVYGDDEINPEIDQLSNFTLVGRRDFNMDGLQYDYVPCASCKIEELRMERPIRRRIGILDHVTFHNSPLTYERMNMDLKLYSINNILEFIASSKVIVTSSYHGMYWATLMKKKVIVGIDWSTKFHYFKYPPVLFSGDIEKDIKECKIYPESLEESIQANDNFYNKILEKVKQEGTHKSPLGIGKGYRAMRHRPPPFREYLKFKEKIWSFQ